MKIVTDWSIFPNFSKAEFDCKETGENKMSAEFMSALQAMRTEAKEAFIINSGFRSVKHSKEKNKNVPGFHTQGIAVDISCGADKCYRLVALALKYGFTGIGISQRVGQPRFLHLDRRPGIPVIYSY